MRRWIMGLAVLAVATPAAAAPETWLMSVDRWGNAEHTLLTLESKDGVLSGRFGHWALEGARPATAWSSPRPTATACPINSRGPRRTAS